MGYRFKIREIITNDGTIIKPKSVNIIVGPNNSGKSRFLKDLKNIIVSNDVNNVNKEGTIIIDDLKIGLPYTTDSFVKSYDIESRIVEESGSKYLRCYSCTNIYNINTNATLSSYLEKGQKYIGGNWQTELDALVADKKRVGYYNKNTKVHNFVGTYGDLFVNYLSTEERLLLSRRQRRFGIGDTNTNLMSEVQNENVLLERLSKNTKEMFGVDVVLDKETYGNSILFRVGKDFEEYRKSIKADSSTNRLLSDANMLEDEGDGLRSFVISFVTLNMDDKDIVLLDEPETSLHPPLARQFGKIISESASSGRQIFVSTHSADLLMGILAEEGVEVNIIRITRDRDSLRNTMKVVDSKELIGATRKLTVPLRSTLDGLFSEKVYICESCNDAEFYQLIHDKHMPQDSSIFIYGNGKDALYDISNVYDLMGVQNYRIYDFDVFKNGFDRAIKTFSEKEKKIYKKIRNKVADCLKEADYKNGGLDSINEVRLKESVSAALEDMKEKGIIIHKYGCLESSLIDAGVGYASGKSQWINMALEKVNNLSAKEISNLKIYTWVFG